MPDHAAMSAGLPRLSLAALATPPSGVIRPQVPRESLRSRIVHLGLGAFARAHLVPYTEDANALAGSDWGVTGVSLHRPDQRDRLAPQDGLYTALERDGAVTRARIHNAILAVLVAPEDPQAVLAAMAAPDCAIVSLTVTEKGYGHDPASGELRLDHPDIAHDLAHPQAPRSAIGFLVEAFARRRAAGLAPFTVLCCDNLPHNGRLVAGLVDRFARQREPDLAAWIAQEGAFPSTMVDRIVPAATDVDLADARAATGCADLAPVSHEPFRQWVIEDRFVGGERPRWELAGAQIVADVAPFEHMKLRMLNGAHSAIAYLGYLSGHETVREAVADPLLHAFVTRLWQEEIIPVLPPPPGVSLAAYAKALMGRFANSAIHHRTGQIASDGSQKLPQRLLGTVRERLAQGQTVNHLAKVVAAWIVYASGHDLAGQPIDVRDPMAAELAAVLASAGPDPRAQTQAALGLSAIFGTDLRADAAFAGAVTAALDTLRRAGVAALLRA